MKALLAHPGTQYSAQLARQLYLHDCLSRFWTGFSLSEHGFGERLIRLLPARRRKWLGNRVIAGVAADSVRNTKRLELTALFRAYVGHDPQAILHDRNEAFQRAIPESEIARSDVVIGFDTSSNILADRAAAVGRKLILDQTIAHPRSKAQVYERIGRDFPEWASDLEVRRSEVMSAEDAEHEKAWRVVVASSFTKRTLVANGVDEDKIILNPYGVDLTRFKSRERTRTNRPFRFLFTGLVSARKGIPVLLKAWDTLRRNDAELWIAGPISSQIANVLPDRTDIRILGKIPNTVLPSVMNDCDAFVFPSYFEGFALVLLEAMASGLPVITTDATAGPDLMDDGIQGSLIPAGDVGALAAAMQQLLDSPGLISRMSIAARARAEQFSWDAYGDRWAAILQRVCAPGTISS